MKRVLAFTENINTCDCCGKTNLKGTYAVTDDFGSEFYYGSTCVKNNLGYNKEKLMYDINKTKTVAKYEYSIKRDEIKSLSLNMIEEKKEFEKSRLEISSKYYLKPYEI